MALWLRKLRAIALSISLAGCERPKEAAKLPVTRIVVTKSAHTMVLLHGDKVLRSYRVSLGRGGAGPKLVAGDEKVPEGTYRIAGRNAKSGYYRALRVSYPTAAQIRAAQMNGINPGGDVMIHGLKDGFGWLGPLQRWVDWTKGCIALTDDEMNEVWHLVPDGTVIEIQP